MIRVVVGGVVVQSIDLIHTMFKAWRTGQALESMHSLGRGTVLTFTSLHGTAQFSGNSLF